MSENNMPIQKYRSNGITVSVWQNEGSKGVFHTFSIQRAYKDSEGNWKRTTVFRASDLPVLAELVREAFSDFAVKSSNPANEEIPF